MTLLQFNNNLIFPLFQAFRNNGYSGVSLNDLAKVVGLKKASLYHHFPKGKEQIAQTTIAYMNELTRKEIYNVLLNTNTSPEKRLSLVLKNLSSFYKNGEENCLLGSMALDTNHSKFKKELKVNTQLWFDAFHGLGRSFGYSNQKAQITAEQTLILIQGGIVVSRATDTSSPFKNSLETIKNLYHYE